MSRYCNIVVYIVITVYQCTLNIAISEAYLCLQGSLTWSVFLDFFLEFCEFSVKVYISESADILMYFYDYKKINRKIL